MVYWCHQSVVTEEIMFLPFLKKTVLEDGSAVYSSQTRALEVVQEDAQNPNSLVVFKAPAFGGHEAYVVEIRGEASVAEKYADYWMRWVSVEVGIGFHPDTSAKNYTPSLPAALNNEYDGMISFCFEHMEDPYEVGIDAWEKAGIIDPVSSGPGM
jgi:hypothetical protein